MINKKLLLHKTRNLLKHDNVLRHSTDYQQAENIGVIFSISDKSKHVHVKEFVKKLERDSKKVQVLAFRPKGAENFEFLFDFFTADDITFWGNFTADQVLKFVNKQFDFLFYLDTEPTPIMQNILAMSKAKCRVGKFSEENNEFCDLLISVESNDNIEPLTDQMYKYTRILN